MYKKKLESSIRRLQQKLDEESIKSYRSYKNMVRQYNTPNRIPLF